MANGPDIDDILPQVTPDSVTLDDLAMLAGGDLFAVRGDALTSACGPLCLWWGLVVVVVNGWLIEALRGLVPPPPMPGLVLFGIGAVGSVPLVWRLAWRGLLGRWWSQIVPVLAVTALAGGLILAVADLSDRGGAAAPCVLAALLFAVMAVTGRLPWLLIVAGGWLAVSAATLFVGTPLALHILLATAGVLFLVLPGIRLWRHDLRQAALIEPDFL